MIAIKVNGRHLYIPADTSLVLEQNNNSFDIDNIGSDIIWTFDIPAKPNAMALNSAHYVNVSNHKRYRCEILFNGVIIANGDLYIQSVRNEKTVSCGVVLDGLGENFGGRKLKDNDYGNDVVISQTTDDLEQHRANWVNFLQASLSDNSIYKFFLFTCKNFYKDNEDYGFHQNQRATLSTIHDDYLWCNYINRLFFHYDTSQSPIGVATVTNEPNCPIYGIRLFNQLGNNTEKLNGFAFAPALRLDWLTRKVFDNAGFSIIGDFLTNENIRKLYIQSMNAMDGDLRQFGKVEYIYIINATGKRGIESEHSLPVGIDEITYDGFKCTNTNPTFNFGLVADVDSLITGQAMPGPTAYQPWQYKDEVFMLLIRTPEAVASGKYPKYRCVINKDAAHKDYIYGINRHSMGGQIVEMNKFVFRPNNVAQYYHEVNKRWETNAIIDPDTSIYCIQLTPSTGDSTASYQDPEQELDILGSYTANRLREQSGANDLIVELVQMEIYTLQNGAWDGDYDTVTSSLWIPMYPNSGFVKDSRVEYYGCYEMLSYKQTIDFSNLANTNTSLNVFDTMLRWKQHVPNITNGEFIKKICKFFGLSIYINPFRKEVQLSFVNNVFETDAIDLTDYVIDTERMTYEPKEFKIGVETVLGKKGVAKDFMLEDIKSNSELPPARSKKKCSIFVKNENAYRHSIMDSKTNKYKWELSAGNDKEMVIGNEGDEQEELTTEIAVPNMRVVDDSTTSNRYFCDIATTGNSKLMDNDYTGEFEMIIQQKVGVKYALRYNGLLQWFEYANPTSMSANGSVNNDFLDLATVGKNSVGEKWLRKFYEFKSHQEQFRFVARLPLSMFLAVYSLQQPQHVAVCDEKRWIMVKNRKYLPTKITYEFGKGDFVLTTIECSRPHYD